MERIESTEQKLREQTKDTFSAFSQTACRAPSQRCCIFSSKKHLQACRLTFTLDGVEVLNAQDATNEQFGALTDVVASVSNVEQWYLEERRDFINGLHAFCEEHDYPFPFTLVDEEGTPTAPLEDVSEDTSFLHRVELARPLIQANPEITSKELADALGLKSAIYAHQLKVYVNSQGGANDAFTN